MESTKEQKICIHGRSNMPNYGTNFVWAGGWAYCKCCECHYPANSGGWGESGAGARKSKSGGFHPHPDFCPGCGGKEIRWGHQPKSTG